MFVIVGLGNPGREYEKTFHNTGFNVLDELSARSGIEISKKKCKALVGEGVIKGQRCVLCKPQTYMNLSGESVSQLLSWYKCEKTELIVVYDDIDLPFGKLRFRTEGSAGTHNGMRNIIAELGFSDFPRLRVGIGRPPEFMDLKDYVLSRPRAEQLEEGKKALETAAEAIETYLEFGADKTRVFVGNKG